MGDKLTCPLGHVFGKEWEGFRNCIKMPYQGGCGQELFEKCKEKYLSLGLPIEGQVIGQREKTKRKRYRAG
jgi:hypothetical protein